MPEERPYEVIDKRRVRDDEATASDASEAHESQQYTTRDEMPPLSEEEQRRLAEEIIAPDLHVLIASMAVSLGDQAWRMMGLVANPATGAVERDMAKAKLAIDCVQFLVDKVSPHLEEPRRRELRTLVTNLQINFVQQVGQA
jgi:hypothetical protein